MKNIKLLIVSFLLCLGILTGAFFVGVKHYDFDGDKIPDFIDQDADNDGIPNSHEGKEDLDNDGKPNHLDHDSDGDGLSDTDEYFHLDTHHLQKKSTEDNQIHESLQGSTDTNLIKIAHADSGDTTTQAPEEVVPVIAEDPIEEIEPVTTDTSTPEEDIPETTDTPTEEITPTVMPVTTDTSMPEITDSTTEAADIIPEETPVVKDETATETEGTPTPDVEPPTTDITTTEIEPTASDLSTATGSSSVETNTPSFPHIETGTDTEDHDGVSNDGDEVPDALEEHPKPYRYNEDKGLHELCHDDTEGCQTSSAQINDGPKVQELIRQLKAGTYATPSEIINFTLTNEGNKRKGFLDYVPNRTTYGEGTIAYDYWFAELHRFKVNNDTIYLFKLINPFDSSDAKWSPYMDFFSGKQSTFRMATNGDGWIFTPVGTIANQDQNTYNQPFSSLTLNHLNWRKEAVSYT